MTLIAVGPSARAYGIDKPQSQPVFRQVELLEALEDTYNTDAHLVCYLDRSRSDGRQHRWTKPALQLPIVDSSLLVIESVFIDVDNPNHAAWTDARAAEAIESFSELPLPCGIYFTTHGYRLVQPLVRPVGVLRAERVIREVLSQLDAAGFAVDWAAKDWTRHFRLPNVRRAGGAFRSPYTDYSRMRPVDVVVPILEDVQNIPAPKRKRAVQVPRQWTSTLAEHWQKRARVVGAAIRQTVSADYHEMYLAIGGALLAKSTPPEHVPELVRLIAVHAASSKPEHHGKSARDTVANYAAGRQVTGFAKLNARFPAVADALCDALDDIIEVPPPSVPPPRLEDTAKELHAALSNAGDGLTVIRAECGLGKTHAAMNVAAARARKLTLTESTRAPVQSKTAISVDKNELAQQVAMDLYQIGIPVRRLFGPLSMKRADSTYECRLHDRALPLVNGGQSLPWEFCLGRGRSKCEFYAECRAKDGEEVLSDSTASPRITVGTHAMLGELDAAAGASGLLVIDEPPALLETLTISPDDVETALRRVHDFESRFATEISPVLLAVRDWEDTEQSFADLTASLSLSTTDSRPPMRASSSALARVSVSAAKEIGAASKVMLTLMRAMAPDNLVSVRLEEEPRRIVVTSTRPDITDALRREGSVVAMDANADLHMPAFTKVVGYEPVMHEFAASDGAPVERTHLRCGSSTRKSWLAHGRLVLDTGLLNAVREVLTWASATRLDEIRPVRLGIITMRIVELAIQCAMYPGDASLDETWKSAGQTAECLIHVKDRVGALLSTFRGEISLAHYGATRGLNRMADVDCLATIGDPWPSVPAVQIEARYLGVDADDRLERLCRAELEQAHGRLRAVHRKRPARALHVGRILPGGSAWSLLGVAKRRIAGGRPKAGEVMSLGELKGVVERLGGGRATARALGCSHSTIVKYLAGRGVAPAVAACLREMATGVSAPLEPEMGAPAPGAETPIGDYSFNRGFGTTPPIDQSGLSPEAAG